MHRFQKNSRDECEQAAHFANRIQTAFGLTHGTKRTSRATNHRLPIRPFRADRIPDNAGQRDPCLANHPEIRRTLQLHLDDCANPSPCSRHWLLRRGKAATAIAVSWGAGQIRARAGRAGPPRAARPCGAVRRRCPICPASEAAIRSGTSPGPPARDDGRQPRQGDNRQDRRQHP